MLTTATLRVRADGSPQTWTLVGPTHYQAIANDPLNDSRYIYTLGGSNVDDNFALERPITDLGLSVRRITKTRVRVRVIQATDAGTQPTMRVGLYLNTTLLKQQDDNPNTATPIESDYDWQDVSVDGPDVDSLNFRIQEVSGGAFGDLNLTVGEVYVDIEYFEDTEKSIASSSGTAKSLGSSSGTGKSISTSSGTGKSLGSSSGTTKSIGNSGGSEKEIN